VIGLRLGGEAAVGKASRAGDVDKQDVNTPVSPPTTTQTRDRDWRDGTNDLLSGKYSPSKDHEKAPPARTNSVGNRPGNPGNGHCQLMKIRPIWITRGYLGTSEAIHSGSLPVAMKIPLPFCTRPVSSRVNRSIIPFPVRLRAT